MESCFVNLIEHSYTVIVFQNGVFGDRINENIKRAGANVVMVKDEWGTAVDLNKVEEALKANPVAKALAFMCAETSTGILSDAKALCALAVQYGALSIVDAVTSLGGCPLLVDEWSADTV